MAQRVLSEISRFVESWGKLKALSLPELSDAEHSMVQDSSDVDMVRQAADVGAQGFANILELGWAFRR